ncbi:MAG: alpha/beta hydrolase [Deltaproteobacteria bacterium]|nr:alpha/beta hydrolase [Deltaproteobacteria bacterium]
MAQVSTRRLGVKGVESFVRESGPSDRREGVVFVHGNPGSGEDFEGLLPLVGDFARNVGVVPGYRWHKYARIWRTPLLGELFQLTATRGMLGLSLDADNPKPFPREFVDRMYGYMDWPMKRAVLALYRATDDLSALTQGWGEKLRPHRIRTLVVWGENDAFLPVRYAEVQKQYFDAEVHVVPNAGHWPMIDEPRRVEELVVPFLRRRVSG